MPKIPALPPMTAPDTADEFPVEDVSVGTTKYMTLGGLKTWLQSLTAWVTGAMIGAATIKNTNMDFTITGKVWWEELGRTKLTVAGAAISVTGLPARRYLRIIQITTGATGSATGEAIRFNNDSGGNYDHRRSIASGAAGLTTADSKIDTYGDNQAQSFGIYDIVNDAAANKPMFGTRMVAYPNGGSGVTWVYLSAVWRNAVAAISRVDYLTSGANFTVGSEVIVLGHD